jgi:hypothetical protein
MVPPPITLIRNVIARERKSGKIIGIELLGMKGIFGLSSITYTTTP